MKTLCFTGHRPDKLNGYNPKDNKELLWTLREEIVRYIVEDDVTTFVNGLALGIDQWSAKIVLKLKETYPHIKLVSIAPCYCQYKKWTEDSQLDWYHIACNSDEFYYAEENEYSPSCMQYRNELMVDRSDFCLAVWDGTAGGTANCVQYAMEQSTPTRIIHPKTLKIT